MKTNVIFNGSIINVECEPVENGHIWCQVGDEIIEFKKCSHCQEWHEVSEYCVNRNAKDGLNSNCKACRSSYNKNRYWEKKKESNPNSEQVDLPNELRSLSDTSDMDTLWSDFKEKVGININKSQELVEANSLLNNKIDKLEKENKDLREANEKLVKDSIAPIDINRLTERDIERYLSAHNLPLRILLDAITAQASNIVINILDTETGLTRTVKYLAPMVA